MIRFLFLQIILFFGITVHAQYLTTSGKEILDKSKLKILSASDLNDAAKKIVEAIK